MTNFTQEQLDYREQQRIRDMAMDARMRRAEAREKRIKEDNEKKSDEEYAAEKFLHDLSIAKIRARESAYKIAKTWCEEGHLVATKEVKEFVAEHGLTVSDRVIFQSLVYDEAKNILLNSTSPDEISGLTPRHHMAFLGYRMYAFSENEWGWSFGALADIIHSDLVFENIEFALEDANLHYKSNLISDSEVLNKIETIDESHMDEATSSDSVDVVGRNPEDLIISDSTENNDNSENISYSWLTEKINHEKKQYGIRQVEQGMPIVGQDGSISMYGGIDSLVEFYIPENGDHIHARYLLKNIVKCFNDAHESDLDQFKANYETEYLSNDRAKMCKIGIPVSSDVEIFGMIDSITFVEVHNKARHNFYNEPIEITTPVVKSAQDELDELILDDVGQNQRIGL